jgi:endoglucanase
MDNIKQQLQELVIADGVSGYEWEMDICKTIQQLIGVKGKKIGDNLVYLFKGRGKKIVISAHMDEVGFFITNKKTTSFQVVPIGDVSLYDVLNASLTFTSKKVRFNVDTKSQSSRYQDLKIKSNKGEVGDVGTFKKGLTIKKNIISSPSLDNRVGCLVLIHLIKDFIEMKRKKNVTFIFTSREEIGTNGIAEALKRISPDISIDIDSAYAKPLSENRNWQIPEIGKGPAIQLQGKNFIIKSENRRFVERICEKYLIGYQYEIPYSNSGGTNASIISSLGYNVFQINIPVANQHSERSLASLKDIDNTITLMRRILVDL